jgi:hypothetical protein
MSWQDRLKEMVYTSPSGVEFTLQYEDVSKSIKKKTSVFEFIGTNDVYVQDNFVGAMTIPVIVYFSGDDHDTEANEFFAALSEKGAGKLQHPLYGLTTVNPVGDIKRSDKLVTGANQSAFDVTFIETIVDLYPQSQSNQTSNAYSASNDFNSGISEEFAHAIVTDSETERQSLKSQITNQLSTFKSGLKSLTDSQSSLQKDLNDSFDSINDGIDLLISDPLTLAFQTVQMIKSVTGSTALISDRLAAYHNLLCSITCINQDKDIIQPSYDATSRNTLAVNDLFASATVSAMNESLLKSDLNSRDEAFNAATTVTDSFYELQEWREKSFASLSAVDTGEGYQALQSQTALTASAIIAIALSLKAQRTVILDRDLFLIDFAYRYFGSTDNDAVEEAIILNDLNNSEIFTLPRGRLMRYYS